MVIEKTAVDRLLPIHAAQLLTSLELSDRHPGFLLNWNVKLMRNGIRRLVHEDCFEGFASSRFNRIAPEVCADALEPGPWIPVPTHAASCIGSDIR